MAGFLVFSSTDAVVIGTPSRSTLERKLDRMGHDFIDIGDSNLRLNDFHIWTLRNLLLDAMAEDKPELRDTDEALIQAFRSFLESWQWLGPGVVVGCNFNDFTTTPGRLRLLHSLLKLTRDRLSQFGETIPMSYLDQHVNDLGVCFTTAPPVATFTDIIDRLISLIPKQIPDG